MATVWATTEDGRFKFVSLTKDKYDEALCIMRDTFLREENVAVATELDKNPNAVEELMELMHYTAKDGCSIIAVEETTGIVAGAAFNKLLVPSKPGEEHYIENLKHTCKEEAAKSLIQYMIDCEEELDLFKECNADCVLELMFVATHPNYRKMGIGKKLFESTIAFAKKLIAGENVKQAVDNQTLMLNPIPKVISAINSSFITQHISEKTGFVRALEIPFEKWSFKGRSYAERIGPDTAVTTIDYLKLV